MTSGAEPEPMPPEPSLSDALWILADGYFDAGEAVLKLIRSDYSGLAFIPCLFLFFRSIELSLKSLLAAHGVDKSELRREFSHRISKLLSEVEKRGTPLDSIGIPPPDRVFLDACSNKYFPEKWFEYEPNFCEEQPEPDIVHDFARRVLSAARIHRLS